MTESATPMTVVAITPPLN
jgi:hypothetical protein